jgi:hypothetical protein
LYGRTETGSKEALMSFDPLGDLNWLAVVVGTLAYFVVGAIWYSPFFLGKPWMKAAGMEPPADGDATPGAAIFLGPLVFSFIATIATAMLAQATGSNTFGEGLALGIVVGIGYAGSILGVTAVFESNKPNAKVWGAISFGYHFVGLLASAIIVSVWD